MNASHSIEPAPLGVADEKATLIHDALQALQAAHRIDERDDLTAGSFVEWYERTIPEVRDIKILAGAMEIELARRRGERIMQEGELRGRGSKVVLGTTFTQKIRDQRCDDRLLAEQPEAVTAFVQAAVQTGQVPTVKRALKVARIARGAKYRPTSRSVPPSVPKSQVATFLCDLRAEITRRRKENHDEFMKRRWNSELILKREQTSLLDWIEEQLDRVPTL